MIVGGVAGSGDAAPPSLGGVWGGASMCQYMGLDPWKCVIYIAI